MRTGTRRRSKISLRRRTIPAAASRAHAPGQRRLDRVDRVGLGEDGRGGVALGRRLDMAAGGEDEGRAGVGERGRRPARPARRPCRLHVDDRDVEAAAVDLAERVGDIVAAADDLMAERLRGNPRASSRSAARPRRSGWIAGPRHAPALSVCFGKEKRSYCRRTAVIGPVATSPPPARPGPSRRAAAPRRAWRGRRRWGCRSTCAAAPRHSPT